MFLFGQSFIYNGNLIRQPPNFISSYAHEKAQFKLPENQSLPEQKSFIHTIVVIKLLEQFDFA